MTDEHDLEILHPERPVTIAGRELVLREYGFVEGLRLRSQMQPFLDDLFRLMQMESEPEVDQVLGLIGDHVDQVVAWAAQAAGVTPQWVAGLPPAEGETLLIVWWEVNSPFFVRQLQMREMTRILRQAKSREHSAGATSTATSSPPDTARNALATTPSGS
ncbi:hypothetical protein AN401_07265 [Zobellella denitrificans]|uniref:Uncharacterized protein n=1 Tax=Zobellella denitrificans TaxID=347534 RepID=A0A291HNI9_9GAMM|nr:DUF6631 family protein [Zobellella denitrificans]ATG73682.1 hypothetical protein AN401_07265 [Zobellella denitrificans]